MSYSGIPITSKCLGPPLWSGRSKRANCNRRSTSSTPQHSDPIKFAATSRGSRCRIPSFQRRVHKPSVPEPRTLLGRLFIGWIFRPLLPPAQIDSYIAGLILPAAAPCTAMVFVWSNLTDGEPNFALTQVALNDHDYVVRLCADRRIAAWSVLDHRAVDDRLKDCYSQPLFLSVSDEVIAGSCPCVVSRPAHATSLLSDTRPVLVVASRNCRAATSHA